MQHKNYFSLDRQGKPSGQSTDHHTLTRAMKYFKNSLCCFSCCMFHSLLSLWETRLIFSSYHYFDFESYAILCIIARGYNILYCFSLCSFLNQVEICWYTSHSNTLTCVSCSTLSLRSPTSVQLMPNFYIIVQWLSLSTHL